MNKRIITIAFITVAAIFPAYAQKARPKKAAQPKPIIFAVINDGAMIEPIAYIENKKLTAPVDGGAENAEIKAFNATYYRPKAGYRLIFGGSDDGKVTVKSADAGVECAANMAQVIASPQKAKLKGMVMALATNAPAGKPGSGLRRRPTAEERSEVEALVRSEFVKQKIAPELLKTLRYHNLTALDVDNDGTAELVGSYWVETDPKSRAMLFFIADRSKDGKYVFGHSEYGKIDEENVMSGEIAALDTGIYHELLLDIFDYDGDGVSEVFTYSPSFEGAGFYAYRRDAEKWVKSFEGSNYHCGY